MKQTTQSDGKCSSHLGKHTNFTNGVMIKSESVHKGASISEARKRPAAPKDKMSKRMKRLYEVPPIKVRYHSKRLKNGKLLIRTSKLFPLCRDVHVLKRQVGAGFESGSPLRCPECEFFTFNSKDLLNHALARHRVVAFECKSCKFKSFRATDMMSHHHEVHAKDGEILLG